MPRTIVMGDPTYFSVLGGANPHTRNALGIRKRVDPELAQIQWHELARTMLRYGAEVFVIEVRHPPAPAAGLSGQRGPPSRRCAARHRLARLARARPLPCPPSSHARARHRSLMGGFIRVMGHETRDFAARFEGEANFFLVVTISFTYGKIERQKYSCHGSEFRRGGVMAFVPMRGRPRPAADYRG